MKRPSNNYLNQPVYPIASGIVISKRDDGPYASLIVEHRLGDTLFWTVYEHIAQITVNLYDDVHPDAPIAHMMNRDQLDRYGWHFDHVHFEILKKHPLPVSPSDELPDFRFRSFTLQCFDIETLEAYYDEPMSFLLEGSTRR
ncbi:MAG: M23 family metallopeptidase [Cyclobacteriaceae bacterium]|nr:M23 family metallopeptidase [Cyclobacteriaceae bacterium HetDA_MAG_MS6]